MIKTFKYLILILLTCIIGCKTQKTITQTNVPIEKVKIEEIDSLEIEVALQEVQAEIDSMIEAIELEPEIVIPRKDTISIIGVGDIMMGTNFPSRQYLPGNDGRDLWVDVKDTLKNADVTFGNLEGVILDEGGNQKDCKNPKVCYLFRTPESYLINLIESGFDVLSLSNNHAGDFGEPGRKNTMSALDSIGIEHAGLLDKPYVTFERDNIKYGMVAFSPNKGTVSIHTIDRAKKIVSMLDSIADIVIVSFHGGAEGSKYEHVPRKTEMFYGENRGNVYEFSHTMIDNGADIVFGHGPHVTRALDLYKDRFIIYSLGNFCTYGRFNLRGVNGFAPIIKVYTDRKGKFLKGDIIPIRQLGAGGPRIDADKLAIKKLIQLTNEDFPEVNLKISESGTISLKQL